MSVAEKRYLRPVPAGKAVTRTCPACRPVLLPQPAGGGAPEVLCRAIRLIADGVLDQGAESGLAARLGLSGRHLRRLFVTHLGVTPDGLARSRRAHFARRLLANMQLSVTEVAFAAGYGSVRQFNREFSRVFGGTPSELRASRSSPGRLAADGGLQLRLRFTGPLDWDPIVSFLAAWAVPGVEQVDRRTYRRTIVVDGHPGALELCPGGPDYLDLRVHVPCWETLMHVAAQARRIACPDNDLSSAWLLATSPLTGPLRAAGSAAHVPGAWDPFETGVSAIVRQQLAPTPSRHVMERLVARLGRRVPGLTAWGLTHVFPVPGILARAGTALREIGLTGDHASTLVSYASAAAAGIIRLDGSTTYEQEIRAISAVPGITTGTARYIALRAGLTPSAPEAPHCVAIPRRGGQAQASISS